MKKLGPIFLILVSFTSGAAAHPGQLAKDGCHKCKKKCAPHGIDGKRHCHPERTSGQEVAAHPPTQIVLVKKVVDGDTLLVQSVAKEKKTFQVRVLGIDCPESSRNSKCRASHDCEVQLKRGKKATAVMRKTVEGQYVQLQTWRAKFEKDRFKRTLAYVHLSTGEDVGKMLVHRKFCKDYGFKYPHPRSKAYLDAP